MGFGATNKGESNVAIGVSSKTENATAAIAVGAYASAKANYAIAVGFGAEGNGQWDISIGRFAGKGASTSAGEGRNIAIGDGALKDSGPVNNNTVLGTGAGGNLVGDHNVIIGTYANFHNAAESAINSGTSLEKAKIKSKDVGGKTLYYVETPNVVAIGHRALATQSGAVAVGQQAKAFGVTTVAVGNGSRALNNNAVAMGREANAGESGAIAIGLRANYDKNQNTANAYKKTGANSVAIGVETHAEGTHSVAMGSYATIKALLSTDFIAGKITDKKGNVIDKTSLGSVFTGNGSIAIGSESLVRGTNAVAIGQAAETLGQNAFAGGNDSHANGKSAVAIGDGATALKDSSTAIGSYTKALEGGAGAFGFGAQALTFRSLALGAESLATQGNHAIAIGNQAKTESEDAISMGYQANANKNARNGIAIGKSALSGGKDSLAIGTKATTSAIGAIAFGHEAIAAHENAVALGAGAETAAAEGTNEATVNTFKYSGFAGTAPIATVSVGKKDAERTITNVAAGRINATSTDAINGSQLYLALNTLGNVGNTLVTNVLGGDAAIVKEGDKAGTLTMSNIGGTGKGTIHDAIEAVNNTAKASKTTVVAGDNMQVDEVVADDGSRTYTVATKKDVKFDSVVAGGTKIDANGLTFVNDQGTKIDNTPSISKTGIDAGNQKVTNVQNGTVEKDSKDAVNGGQLFAQGEGVKNIIGGNTTYNPTTGAYTNTDIGGTGASTIHDAIAAVKAQAAQKTQVVEGKNITITNTGTAENPIYNVATKDAVEFDKTTVGSVVTDKNTNDITGLSNKTLGGDNFAKNGRAASEEQLNATQTNLATLLGGNAQNTNGNVTMTDIGGTGKNNINDAIKASRTDVIAGNNMEVKETVGNDGQKVFTVATKDKVNFKEVKVGDNVTLGESGLQAGNIKVDATTNKISGIAKGDISENSTDAVNGSQLYELQQKIAKSGDNYNILNNRINKVDKDLRAGIAGANAAAGLPQAYIPGKSMVAVAAGTYKGQNAIALGMSRISDNGKVIIKLTGNTNSRGDFGASIGAGYQW